MANGIELSPLAPREAIAFFRSKGFAPALQRFDYRDHWREEHARDFVVAKAMQDDVLATIREDLDKAISGGTTLDAFRDGLAPKLGAQGWWGRSVERDPLNGELRDVELGSMRRLKVIFDTNIRTAYAAGQWSRLQRTKAFLPYLEYRQIKRETARDEHKPFDGLILPIDHPIWKKIFPPNGWFCGCYVRPLNQRMLDREGKRLTTDAELEALSSQPWTNPRTGQTEDLLDGIDPAFASNPGAAWLDVEDRHAQSSLNLPDDFAAYDRGYVRELAALRLRDNRDAALVYSLKDLPDDQPIGMTRTDPDAIGPAPLTAAMREAMMRTDEEAVLLRSGATGSGVPLDDLKLMSQSNGLAQVALTSPDGSIFRIGRMPGADFPERSYLDATYAVLRARAEERAAAQGFSALELDLLAQHALALALRDGGRLQYATAPSGQVAVLLGQAAELVIELMGLVS
tara:strand:- start:3350 stop:4720 length:1371 start_codon:yes stop_codon:yes gene_type:complete